MMFQFKKVNTNMKRSFHLERVDDHDVITFSSSEDEDDSSETDAKIETRPTTSLDESLRSCSANVQRDESKIETCCWACAVSLDEKVTMEAEGETNDKSMEQQTMYLYSTHVHPLLR